MRWKKLAFHHLNRPLFLDVSIALATVSASSASPVSKTIRVEAVRLEYLEWGGKGDALVFVPGGCETSHVFSDIAPAFSDRYRVLSLTPRGCGASAKAGGGYDLDMQLRDLRGFLDALDIDCAILAGHSSGAGKITRFARMYPSRVDRLVLFDTVYSFIAPGLEAHMD